MKIVNLFIFLFAMAYVGKAQCKLEHKVSLGQPHGAIEKGSIFLNVKSSDQINLKLFKVKGTSIQQVEEKSLRVADFKKPVFYNLEPSTYFIQASWKECTMTIGGVNGLQIIQSQSK